MGSAFSKIKNRAYITDDKAILLKPVIQISFELSFIEYNWHEN